MNHISELSDCNILLTLFLQTSFVTLDEAIKITNRRVNAIEHGKFHTLYNGALFPKNKGGKTFILAQGRNLCVTQIISKT